MAPEPLRILPIQLQIGDRLSDEEGVWEVTGHPFTTREGKVVHATIQKPGEVASAREKTWGAHERLAIQRADAPLVPKTSTKSKRPTRTRTKGRRQA